MRRRRDDDSGEYARPQRNGANTVLLTVIAVGVGALVLMCGGAGAILFLFTGKVADEVQQQRVKEAARPTWPRDEFRKMLMGKTEKQVIELAGKPDRTSDSDQLVAWTYYDRAVDTVTGKKGSATLFFKGGEVVMVDF